MLPDEILIHILDYIPISESVCFFLCCKQWQKLSPLQQVWQQFYGHAWNKALCEAKEAPKKQRKKRARKLTTLQQRHAKSQRAKIILVRGFLYGQREAKYARELVAFGKSNDLYMLSAQLLLAKPKLVMKQYCKLLRLQSDEEAETAFDGVKYIQAYQMFDMETESMVQSNLFCIFNVGYPHFVKLCLDLYGSDISRVSWSDTFTYPMLLALDAMHISNFEQETCIALTDMVLEGTSKWYEFDLSLFDMVHGSFGNETESVVDRITRYGFFFLLETCAKYTPKPIVLKAEKLIDGFAQYNASEFELALQYEWSGSFSNLCSNVSRVSSYATIVPILLNWASESCQFELLKRAIAMGGDPTAPFDSTPVLEHLVDNFYNLSKVHQFATYL